MAKPTASTEQVIDLVGHTVGAATALLVSLASQLGYAVAPTSPGVYRLARTRRKMFGRVDETLTARVYEARSGPGIRLVGDPADELVAHLREAAVSAAPIRHSPVEPSQVALAQHIDQHSPHAPMSAPPAPAPVHARGWMVDLPDGGHVPIAAALLIGRDPDPRRGPLGSLLVAVADVTVSKTHLLIEPKGPQLAVTDLHSTNGTTVESGPTLQMCPPGVPVLLDSPGIVSPGDARLLVRPVQ